MSFSASSSCLALDADDGSENADALLALLHLAAKLVPCVQPSNAGCVRPLPCNFQDVAEAVVVEAAHGVEVGGECIAVSCLKLLDKALDVGGDDFFGGLPLLRLFGVFADGVTVLVAGVHGCFLLGFGRCFSCHAWHVPTCRTPPGEGGGSKVQGEGYLPPLKRSEAEWKGRSAAEVCTSAARKIGETPCAARGAEPLSIPGRCFTKQTGDMVYTMAENSWLSQLWLDA